MHGLPYLKICPDLQPVAGSGFSMDCTLFTQLCSHPFHRRNVNFSVAVDTGSDACTKRVLSTNGTWNTCPARIAAGLRTRSCRPRHTLSTWMICRVHSSCLGQVRISAVNGLNTRGFVVLSPAGTTDFSSLQIILTDSRAHTTSCWVVLGRHTSGMKVAGA